MQTNMALKNRDSFAISQLRN